MSNRDGKEGDFWSFTKENFEKKKKKPGFLVTMFVFETKLESLNLHSHLTFDGPGREYLIIVFSPLFKEIVSCHYAGS